MTLEEALAEHGLSMEDVLYKDGVVWKKEDDGSKLFLGIWAEDDAEEDE